MEHESSSAGSGAVVRTRGRTHVLCVGSWVAKPWATRESPYQNLEATLFLWYLSSLRHLYQLIVTGILVQRNEYLSVSQYILIELHAETTNLAIHVVLSYFHFSSY